MIIFQSISNVEDDYEGILKLKPHHESDISYWFEKSDSMLTCFFWDEYTVPRSVMEVVYCREGRGEFWALVGTRAEIPSKLEYLRPDYYRYFFFYNEKNEQIGTIFLSHD